MALDMARIIKDARRNPNQLMIYGSIFGGGLVILVLLIVIVSQLGIFSGGDQQKMETAAVGTPIRLNGGVLVVTVDGVEKRPLATFGADTGGQNVVALQVKLAVQYFPPAGDDQATAATIGEMLIPGTNISIRGVIPGDASSPGWSDIVIPADNDARYSLLSSPPSVAGDTIRGSVLFKIPVRAGQLSVVLAETDEDGLPLRTITVPVETGE